MITTLWIAIAALLMLALAIIWWPHIRQNTRPPVTNSSRTETNTQIYRANLEKLQRQLDDEMIDELEYKQLKAELDHKLLQDEEAAKQQLEAKPRSKGWPIVLSLVMVAISATLYYRIGAYHKLDPAMQAGAPHGQMSQEQLVRAQLLQLEKQTQEEPENSEAWFNLGHTYISVGEFDKSIAAFDKVIALVGERAEFFGPQAQALYYKNNQQLTPEVQAKIDQALALDPNDVATLVLLGMHNYMATDYAKAIEYWQKVLDNNRPDIDREALTGAISDAKQRLIEAGEPVPETPVKQDTGPAAEIAVEVSVDPSLKELMKPEQVVFIYAIAIEGPRMPLAAVKLTAGELPTKVMLNDAMAMTPNLKLSSVDQVHIFGIVSQSGTAGIQPGDLQGILRGVATRRDSTVRLLIDQRVPQQAQ